MTLVFDELLTTQAESFAETLTKANFNFKLIEGLSDVTSHLEINETSYFKYNEKASLLEIFKDDLSSYVIVTLSRNEFFNITLF